MTRIDSPDRHTRIATVLVIVVSTALLTWLLSVQLMAKPIGDDYIWISQSRSRGVEDFVTWFLTQVTGRYGNAVLLAVSLKLLGTSAIIVVPVVLTLGLVSGSVVVARQLLARFAPAASDDWLRAAALGTSASASALATSSVFDGFLWFNSVAIFLASLTAVVWGAVVVLAVGARIRREWLLLLVLGVVGIVLLGFSESTAVLVGAAAGAAAVAMAVLRRWRAVVRALVVALSALVALGIVYVLPGTRTRVAIQDAIFPETTPGMVLRGTLGSLSSPLVLVSTWRLALVLLIAVAILASIRLPRSPRGVALTVAIAGVLILGPTTLSAFLTYLTVQSAPYRSQTVALMLCALGWALLIAVVVRVAAARLPFLVRAGVPAAAIVAAVALLAPAPALTSISQAVSLRQSLVDYRDATLAEGPRAPVMPAPLLLRSTEATELAYTGEQTGWFVAGLEAFYGVQLASVGVDTQQPAGYCLTGDASAWPDSRDLATYFGAKSCWELAHR